MRANEFLAEGLHFLKPGELKGSYTDSQLKSFGFKLVNGKWAINADTFKKLTSAGQLR